MDRDEALTGRRFGTYLVQERIGAGGMGEVYRARDTKLARDIAIKILPSAFTDDPDRLARFAREARMLAALNHPNIATIHGFEESDGVHAIVMELVEGDTLAERIARSRGPIPVDEALAIARQIADALEAAHEKGIVHRDLKPANIKITPTGVVKALDFGLAKVDVGDAAASQAPTVTMGGTHKGLILGTVAYMSPEQARGLPVDKRTDVWAFGCVLYEMLTGQAAFARKTISDTIAAILDREPEWTALPAATTPTVRRLLRRCLEKDSRRRLRDIGDARLEIEDPIDSAVEVFGPGRADGGTREREGPPVVWIALAGLIAAGLAGVGVATFVSSRDGASASTAVSLSVLPARGTIFPATGAWPVVSPDGRHVAFVAAAIGGEQRLWLRQLDSLEARPLSGTEGAIRPFWSPDSRSIGFFANGHISRVDIETGAARVLGDAPYSGGLAGSWGDGVIVFNIARGIHRISPSGGEPLVVIRKSDDANVLTPSFLPDGRRFLYQAQSKQEGFQTCIASLDSDETSCVESVDPPAVYAAPGYLLFVRDGALLAQPFDAERLQASGEPLRVRDVQIAVNQRYEPPFFSGSRNGVLVFHAGTSGNQLVWHDRSGTRLGPALGPGGRPALSQDRSLLAVQRRDGQRNTADLWIYDLRAGTDFRFTFDPADESWPTFSPNGQVVLFSFTAGGPGPARLFQKRASGDAREEPLVPDVRGINPHWSSDGRFILFQRPGGVQNSIDLFAVRLGTSDAPIPIAQTEHGEREGRFSPDVRWIAYDSTETGRREVWIQPFPPTGARWQISRSGGVSPQWRADGKELFYAAGDGRMMAVPIEAGGAIRAGSPTPLFQTIFSGGVYANYAVANDGQRFLVSVPPALEDAAPITVVLNWPAQLAE
jgi:Tol biopolymer transport system component